jgi:ABC-type transporter Mla MlaB component
MGRSKSSAAPAAKAQDVAASLVLSADLGIEHAAALKSQLLSVATQAAPLRLDGAAVSRLHAAAVQLLAALCRDRRDGGLATHWSQASETLRAAATTLGLNDSLELHPEQR